MSHAPTMRDGEKAIREAIAMNHNRIAQERAFTIERIDRLQRFARGDLFKQREREEWNAFNDRIHYLVRENEVMVQTLADLEATRASPPVIATRAALTPAKGTEP